VVTAANVPDMTMLEAMVDDIPPVRTPSGRRRHRPDKLDADKGYDSASNRAWLRRHGITARIARRGIESSTRLGGIAGGWSGRCRGCRATDAWRFAGIRARNGGSRS
jgi:IS5 family transposase